MKGLDLPSENLVLLLDPSLASWRYRVPVDACNNRSCLYRKKDYELRQM